MKHVIANIIGCILVIPKDAASKTFHVKQSGEPTADDVVCTIIGGALLVLLYCAFTYPG